MTLFWLVVGLMTTAATAFVLWPLLRPPPADGIRRRDVNVALYRERMQELENARARLALSAEDTLTARAESERRLLDDAGDEATVPAQPSAQPSFRWALVLAFLLPAAAVSFYVTNSDWRLALTPEGPKAVQLLLGRLEQHLAKNPNDAGGWQLLAQSRLRLGNYQSAADAYGRAYASAPSADLLAGQAEALGLAAGGSMQGRPTMLIEEALRLDPAHPRALWYAGLAASQRGDNPSALKHWNRLAGQTLPPEFRKLLNAAIVQAGGTAVLEPAPLQLSLVVSLHPTLKAVPGDTPLFVYARAAGEKGGPPLAVVRKRVADLPLRLSLSDADSMLPTRKLSSAEAWRISARVALQGSAEARPGDFLAEADVSAGDRSKPVNLQIKDRMP